MRRIALVTGGTRGDVQPYIALGKGLTAAGYDVRLLGTENFADLAAAAGLHFAATGPSVEERLQSDVWRATLDGGNFLTILARMRAEMQREAAEQARRLPPLLEGSDLIVAGMAGYGGAFTVAVAFGIPVVQAHVYPFTPTRAFPSPLAPHLPLGRVLNRASFHVTRQMFWQMLRAGDAATRAALGLSKPAHWGPFAALERSGAPVLYGYSRHVLPRPDDWPAQHQVTGYWFLDEDGWQPPASLEEFLGAGAPPVYVGFGSMGSRTAEEAGRIALEALERSGQRGVLASGWGGLQPLAVPETVHVVSSLPHAWLFPRMAAVVHHGGAGTTAAGLRAGVPSIAVPFMGDQLFWGRRITDLGVGPQPIPRSQLTAERLAQAITTAVATPAMQQRAHALGDKIRAENGIAHAVVAVDGFMQRQETHRARVRTAGEQP